MRLTLWERKAILSCMFDCLLGEQSLVVVVYYYPMMEIDTIYRFP